MRKKVDDSVHKKRDYVFTRYLRVCSRCHPALAEPEGNVFRSSEYSKTIMCSLCVCKFRKTVKIRLYLVTWEEEMTGRYNNLKKCL